VTNRVLVVAHRLPASLGRLGTKLVARGLDVEVRCPIEGDVLPPRTDDYRGVVVLGGPMSANDDGELPGIRAELDWIPEVLATKTAYLGICLGAQLLARVLGSPVRTHPDGAAEIGYYPLYPTVEGGALFPSTMNVYHWHTEGFELPSGSQLLATGETFQNQAFRFDGNVYGLQFHPEVTKDILLHWLNSATERLALPGAQQADGQLDSYNQHHEPLGHWFDRFLDQWLSI